MSELIQREAATQGSMYPFISVEELTVCVHAQYAAAALTRTLTSHYTGLCVDLLWWCGKSYLVHITIIAAALVWTSHSQWLIIEHD